MEEEQAAFWRRQLLQRGGLGRRGERGQGGAAPFAARKPCLGGEGAGGMKDGGGLGKCVCQQWADPASASSCQAGRHFQGACRKGQRAGSGDKSLARPPHALRSPSPPATPGGQVCGGTSVPSPSPCRRHLPGNVLHLARRVHVTPRSAGSVPLYTSENH